MLRGHIDKQNTLERAGDFDYFLWRRHTQSRALRQFVPELLATDGRVVRRLVTQDRQLIFQEFVDESAAQTIVASVEATSSSGMGMFGYSMFADCDALAIRHTGEGLEPGWLAFPYPRSKGRPSSIPTLPLSAIEVPDLRLMGGAELVWRDCSLVLDAAIEQRGESGFDLLEHLVSWELETTWLKKGRAHPVRLASKHQAGSGFTRSSPGRAEASFAIDAQLYQQLGAQEGLAAWFVLEFDRRLFCLPQEWCRWWFSVGFPSEIGK